MTFLIAALLCPSPRAAAQMWDAAPLETLPTVEAGPALLPAESAGNPAEAASGLESSAQPLAAATAVEPLDLKRLAGEAPTAVSALSEAVSRQAAPKADLAALGARLFDGAGRARAIAAWSESAPALQAVPDPVRPPSRGARFIKRLVTSAVVAATLTSVGPQCTKYPPQVQVEYPPRHTPDSTSDLWNAEERQELLQKMEDRMVWTGVSKDARNVAAQAVRDLFDQVPIEDLRNMDKHQVFLVIIPKDKKLTDLPQAAPLKGKKTFDGREWSTVRGAGDVDQPDGSKATFVAEENLIDGADGYNHKLFLVAHEMGHALELEGMPAGAPNEPRSLVDPVTRQEIQDAYANAKSPLGELTDTYAGSNELEYFGQGTAIWFGVGHSSKGDLKDVAWIKENDHALYAILWRTYGPSRRLFLKT